MRTAHRLGRRLGVATAGVLALAGFGAGFGAAPAGAADPVTCGQTVTASVSLTTDLVCPGGDGLVVGASGIVIDLKGHTITGGWPATSGAGVRVYQYGGVEIRNGTITRFANGVRLDTNSGNRVWNITFADNWRGVDVANSHTNLVEKNRFSGTELDSVRIGGVSNANVVQQNVLTANVWGVGVGDDSTNTLVSRNQVTGSRDWGVAVFTSGAGTVVSQNVVSGDVVDGIRIQSPGTQVVQNTTSANGDDGIDVTGAGSTLRGNLATYNGDYGIEATVAVVDGGGNKAWGNGNPAQCLGVACASA